MLIISKEHDYYDPVASLGIDKQCPYKRKTEVTKFSYDGKMPSPPSTDRYSSKKHHYHFYYHVMGFCGTFYPFITVKKLDPTTKKVLETLYFYDESKILEYVNQEKIQYRQYVSFWSRIALSFSTTDGLSKFFNPKTWSPFLHYFQEKKVPIFLMEPNTITLNPLLRQYEFQKIKDPYTAFQDLYMFISGVLGVESRPMIEISDKDKAAAKGHDGKYSFRKPKGKRGRIRWR